MQRSICKPCNFYNFQIKMQMIVDLLSVTDPHSVALKIEDLSTQGFTYDSSQNFVTKHSLLSKYSNILVPPCEWTEQEAKKKLEFRFFFDIKKNLKTKYFHEFLQNCDSSISPQLFFIPYFNINSVKNAIDEDFLSFSCAGEIKIIYTKNEPIELLLFRYQKSCFDVNIINIESILNNEDINDFYSYKKNIINEIHLPDQFILDMISKVKEHMYNGDCYLINLTHTQKLPLKEDNIFDIKNYISVWFYFKSRFGFFISSKNFSLASFSPERFLQKKGRFVCTEPIKGTVQIGTTTPQLKDAKKIWENKKEIYEHTLVVDLLRNDLNRICKAGSVIVYKPFFARVAGSLIQMQSFILGELDDSIDWSNCFEKTLPVGSITGTPKIKVCEFISRYEMSPRSYYTGIAGILEINKDFDSIVLIRSLFKNSSCVYFGVGSGITTLSNEYDELQECYIKINSFLHWGKN